jgi:predicted regulator of Ras-like GTPase activity (Roadblock/LC7/MglB family)
MNKLDQLILKFSTELGSDFICTDVVGMEDGLSVAGSSVDQNFNTLDASSRFSKVMDVAAKTFGKAGMGKVDDNLTTTDKAYIIARFIGDGSYYWVVTVTRNATLGSLRAVMNEYVVQINDLLPH